MPTFTNTLATKVTTRCRASCPGRARPRRSERVVAQSAAGRAGARILAAGGGEHRRHARIRFGCAPAQVVLRRLSAGWVRDLEPEVSGAVSVARSWPGSLRLGELRAHPVDGR